MKNRVDSGTEDVRKMQEMPWNDYWQFKWKKR
jgi:hypothetical protein